MRWGFVLELALPGLAIGIAVVLGMSELPAWVLWVLLRIVTALVIARGVRRKHFAHGFFAGALGAASALLCAAAFFPTYAQNHPEYLEQAARLAADLDPRILLAILAAAAGLVHGIVQGTLAWLASRILTSR